MAEPRLQNLIALIIPVHGRRRSIITSVANPEAPALLTARKLLQEKAIAIGNDIRGWLRNFGLKVGLVGEVKFDERLDELVEDRPDLREIMQPLLAARKLLCEEFAKLHKKVQILSMRMKSAAG